MKKLSFLGFLALFLSVLHLPLLLAQDVDGSEDHPLIERYTGSRISSYGKSNFASYPIFLDPYVEKKPIQAEGKFFSIRYSAPSGKSPLEVHRNYEVALEQAGFEKVYECRNCDTWRYLDANPLKAQMPTEHYDGSTGTYGNSYYTSYKRGGTYVALYSSSYYDDETRTTVDIVESEEMETGLVKVNADAIKKMLNRDGKLALYGITFDTGSANIKPSSDEELGEVAKFLKANPSVKLYIVGHTDDTGGMDLNQSLSEKRAKAVVSRLADKYGIAISRLIGKGVGPFAPVASNSTEKGKAKNRRVELVKRLK